ncbi:MAG TPA: hypothetical protein VHT91_43160 [Kofleriaceae bacterium]|jgi:protein-tyrosine-phosphatase|nr:hypothetical protein [Kofleriaceae bacterium]
MTGRQPQTVLFMCERNAGRSQVAAALFNRNFASSFRDARL